MFQLKEHLDDVEDEHGNESNEAIFEAIHNMIDTLITFLVICLLFGLIALIFTCMWWCKSENNHTVHVATCLI